MLSHFNAEIFKFQRRPLVWWLGGLLLGLVVLFGYTFPYMTFLGVMKDSATQEEIDTFFAALSGSNVGPWVNDLVSRFGGAFAVALGAMTVGAEFSWNTMKTVLTQRGSRSDALGGTLLALGAVIAGGVVLGIVGALLAGLAINALAGTSPSLPDPATLFPSMGAAWLSFAAWAVVGAALAMLLRSPAISVSIGLVYVLGVEMLVGLAAPHVKLAELVSKGLIGPNASVLARSIVADGIEAAPTLVTPVHAVAVLLAFAVAAIAVMATLQRRDYA